MITAILFLIGASGATFALGWLLCQHRTKPAAPPLHFVRAWKPLAPEEWAKAFRDWPESDPRWRALWDLTSSYLETEIAELQGVKPDPHEIIQRSGRLQMVLFLRAQMLNLRNSRTS